MLQTRLFDTQSQRKLLGMLIIMYQSYCMPGAPKILVGVPLVVPEALKYPKNQSCQNGLKTTPTLLLKILRNLAEALFWVRFSFGTELDFCAVALSRKRISTIPLHIDNSFWPQNWCTESLGCGEPNPKSKSQNSFSAMTYKQISTLLLSICGSSRSILTSLQTMNRIWSIGFQCKHSSCINHAHA